MLMLLSRREKNVEQTKALGAEYVEQVKALAQGALDTAQVWLPNAALEAGNEC